MSKFAALIVAAVKLDDKAASLRVQMYTQYRDEALAAGVGTAEYAEALDEFHSTFTKVAREAITKGVSQKMLEEIKGLDAEAIRDILDMDPTSKQGLVIRRKNTLKVRASEAKRLFTALMAGDLSAERVYEGTLAFTRWASEQPKAERAVTTVTEGETEGEGETEADSAYTLDKFVAAVSAQISAAEKAGILPDALAALATLVTDRSPVAK